MKEENLKEMVKVLYLNGFGVDDISQVMPKSKSTFHAWIKEGGWKEDKESEKTITEKQLEILENLTDNLEKLSDVENENDLKGDEISKITLSISRLMSKEKSIEATVSIGKEYIKYLQKAETPKEDLRMIANYYQEFLKWKAKGMGS